MPEISNTSQHVPGSQMKLPRIPRFHAQEGQLHGTWLALLALTVDIELSLLITLRESCRSFVQFHLHDKFLAKKPETK